MRVILAATLTLLLNGGAFAQGTPEQAVKTDPGTVQSQQPEPSAQGNRSPDALPSPTETPTLTQALEAVRNSPIDLQGNPLTPAEAQAGQPSPAAPTASGCGTTEGQLAGTAPGSTPCPQAGSDPVPGGGTK